MALEAGVWTFFLPKTFKPDNVRDVVDLVRSRTEQHAVHDGRHMTRNTATGFRVSRMSGMQRRILSQVCVALGAHAIGVCSKAQGFEVVRRIFAMKVVAM